MQAPQFPISSEEFKMFLNRKTRRQSGYRKRPKKGKEKKKDFQQESLLKTYGDSCAGKLQGNSA